MFGQRTSISVAVVTSSLPYECDGCGYDGWARASVRGRAGVQYLGDHFAAQAEAEMDAVDSGYRNIAALVRLAPCPKCGARPKGAVSRFLLRWSAYSVGIFGFSAVVVSVAVLSRETFPLVARLYFLMVPALCIGAVVAPLMGVDQWRSSSRKVEFLDERDPASESHCEL